ncbi:MAG: DUF4129 domain-containing protein [Deltaproteobacteria bacterium]|nr:DUF4129 domain-containing protein [Deltaproteobacteria bacterium]
MNLASVSAEMRPRGQWEAIDLGLRMVRAHYAVMLGSSLVISLPLFALLHLLFWEQEVWAILILWWLKPLWERCHLYVLSRSLFGPAPSLGETVKAFPGYGFRQWLPWLTIRRLNPMRSLDLPVTQLEGLSGGERQRRLEILHRGSHSSAGIWLTTLAVHVEAFLGLAGIALVVLLAPASSEGDVFEWFFGNDDSRWESWVSSGLGYAAALLVAPFYVGGGFALYVNRRTVLEGWDIEIAFRRLAARIEKREEDRSVRAAVALLAALAGSATLGLGFLPHAAGAASGSELTPELARQSIETVLEGEAFHRTRTTHIPRFVLDLDLTPEEQEESDTPEWLTWLVAGLLRVAAASAEVLLIAAALAALGYLVYRYRKEIARLAGKVGRPGSPVAARPGYLFGLDVQHESLPEDVAEAVLHAWRGGARRRAYGLLYRATLAELIEHYGLEFHSGYTERDCVAVADAGVSRDCADFFTDLTRHWQLLAYAHRAPSDEVMESLCAAWPRFFGAAAEGEERLGD